MSVELTVQGFFISLFCLPLGARLYNIIRYMRNALNLYSLHNSITL